MSNVMSFKLKNGKMSLVCNDVIEDMRKTLPISTSYIVDIRKIKKSIKDMDFLKGKAMSVAPVGLALGVATGGTGVFWNTFMTYIFPYLMDIAKVYCVIKIAQGFYEERRGGRDGGTGIQSLVTYGKWYLLFMLIPFGVELIDQLGNKMLTDLKINPITTQ